MGIASEMKELTRNIATSHEDRMRRLGEIGEEANEARGEAQSLITGFAALRRETNQQARRELVRDKAHRKSETRGILKEARDILKGFEASRKEANARLREELSEGAGERQAEVNKALEGARKLVRGFHVSRQNVSSRLRKGLGISRVKSRSEADKVLGNAQSLLKNFQISRREEGSQLRRDLAQSKADMESGVKQMISDFGQARGDVRADLREARAAWQGLSPTSQARKAGVEIPAKAETSAAREEPRDLDAEMLASVSEHPEGISLAGVAENLGVALIVLGRASKSLLDKGKIRKDEKLYFPVASE